MSTTTNAKKRGVSLPLIILLVQGIVVLGLWIARPYLQSEMSVDKQELEQRLEEVKKRSEKRKKEVDEKRKKKKLKKEDVEKLKKEARKKHERKIRDRIEEMNKMRKEIKEEKREKLEIVKEHEIQEELASQIKRLQEDVAKLDEQAKDIDKHSNAKQAEELSKVTGDLKKEADALNPEDEHVDVEQIKQLAKKASETSKKLQEMQKEVAHNPNKRKELGKEHQTEEYREDLAKVEQNLNEISDGSFKDDLDFSEINDQIADEGMTLDPDELLNMEIEELYDVAKQLEQEISEDYAALRAAELSAIQDKNFNESFEQIAKNQPQREDFDFSQMGQEIENLGDVGEYRGELETVAQEVHKMWQNTQNMHGQAQGFDRLQQQGAQSKAQAKAQMQAQQAIAQAAQMQTGQSVMIDMSAQMRQSYQMGSGRSDPDAQIDPDRLADNQSSLGAAAKITKKRIQVNTGKIKAEALPGRKFTDASGRKGWLYIDTWYVVGPWNATFKSRQIDWDTIHPPEYEIDLAKEYIGKKGKTLRWQFTQSNTLRTTPPDEQSNSTYYAYTEVHFDKDRDMLLAIASDDAAKVWVNDILVWQDNGLSAWNLDEGFRKVAFKKGFNKVLVRIANGPVVCQYSLLLCPPDVK